jgi:gliding motility-associated protein GldE
LDIDWKLKVLFLLICFILSAFFSGSEVALFSIDKKKIKSAFSNSPLIQNYLINLIEHPRRLLVSILIGNTAVNVTASIIAVSLALELATHFGFSLNVTLTLQIIILTFLILLFGEVTPKIWASKDPIAFSKIIAIPTHWVIVIIYPISETITEIIRVFVAFIRIDKRKSAIKHDEIKELATLSLEKGTIEDEEHELIHSIFGFKDLSVSEIMTPRVDMVAVSSDADFTEVVNQITKTGRSRIPLYKDDLDDIIGIIYAKDLLPYFKNTELRKNLSLSKLARKPMFVPRTKMIDDLMHEFQEKKMHLAIVVDEYGGTAGLISLEDIIEEIIGEIRDEYDKEESSIVKIDENNYTVLGRASVEELKETLDLNIDNADYDTVAGFVLNAAGQIPKEGYSFDVENYKFTVKEVQKKRINKVQVERIIESKEK